MVPLGDPPAPLDLLGDYIEAKLLLQRPCDRAANGVVLPAGDGGDLSDCRAV